MISLDPNNVGNIWDDVSTKLDKIHNKGLLDILRRACCTTCMLYSMPVKPP